MITKIELTNFKSHAHTVIEPGRVTALVGPNGCGKTSFLQAVNCFLRVEAGENPYFVFSNETSPDYLVRQGDDLFAITIQGNWPVSNDGSNPVAGVLKLTYELKPQGGKVAWKMIEQREVAGTMYDEYPVTPNEHAIGGKFFPPEHQLDIDTVKYMRASAEMMAQPSYSALVPPILEPDGRGLASVLTHLKLEDSAKLNDIERALRAIVPIVKNFNPKFRKVTIKEKKLLNVGTTPVPYEENLEVTGQELYFDTISAQNLPAHAMSEGTLLTLGLLTLFWDPSSPKLFLLDDIERGLHPLAQRQLLQVIKDFAEKHDRQIILTSHSPYIIDELPAEDVWVMVTDKEGISHCNRLSNHPDKDRALEVLTTGEFLSAEGEEWVIDNPFVAETVNA